MWWRLVPWTLIGLSVGGICLGWLLLVFVSVFLTADAESLIALLAVFGWLFHRFWRWMTAPVHRPSMTTLAGVASERGLPPEAVPVRMTKAKHAAVPVKRRRPVTKVATRRPPNGPLTSLDD